MKFFETKINSTDGIKAGDLLRLDESTFSAGAKVFSVARDLIQIRSCASSDIERLNYKDLNGLNPEIWGSLITIKLNDWKKVSKLSCIAPEKLKISDFLKG